MIRDATGLAVDYAVEGDYPAYGNNDDRADAIAAGLVRSFMAKVRRHPAYRGAEHTQSVLTITSNVVYGRHTGNTPTAAVPGSPSRRAPTRCTAATATASRRARRRSRRSPIATPPTGSR